MGFVLTAIFGFVVWIVLWSLGVKAFDAFMITVADPRGRGDQPASSTPLPAGQPRPITGP